MYTCGCCVFLLIQLEMFHAFLVSVGDLGSIAQHEYIEILNAHLKLWWLNGVMLFRLST